MMRSTEFGRQSVISVVEQTSSIGYQRGGLQGEKGEDTNIFNQQLVGICPDTVGYFSDVSGLKILSAQCLQ
jgi:hypothetical protein